MRDAIKANLVKYTDNTLTSLTDLDANIERTLKNGYAIDNGEYRERVYSFGAPICLPNGEAVAALGISVPDTNLPADGRETMGALVRDAAKSVSKRLKNL